jgi:hypothetical protein
MHLYPVLALAHAGALVIRPNVIFTLVDDWGSFDAAFRERALRPEQPAQLHTPTIDALASEGMLLDRYYTQHICSPTRSALLSGRYQIHTGLQDGIIQDWARVCLPPSFGTLGDAFTSLGYRSAMIGKWHAGIYRDACLPWNRGFATYFGYLTGSELHYTKINRTPRGSPPGSNSSTRMYPDLRTEAGPVRSYCITPPLDPPAPPAPPCGLPGQPPCSYTQRSGYLPGGHDAVDYQYTTLDLAKASCDALANCSAITFEAADPADCESAPYCKIFFKTAEAGTSASGDGWLTYFKYPVPPSSEGDPSCYSTHLFTAEAIRVIQGTPPLKPLFLYLALQDVHEPLEVPAKYIAPFTGRIMDGGRRTYAAMVSVVDECLANVTGALKAARMWENTILVVSNDNGGWMGYGGLNTPYRGHKTTLWEGGIRGISFVVAPGRLTPGSSFGGLFHVTDWLPTLVAAAGSTAASLGPTFAGLDGINQWHALTAVQPPVGRRDGRGRALLAPSDAAEFPRTEILHNIEGVEGSGVAVVRVGAYKLLHRMQAARGFDGWCDLCNHTGGCWIPPNAGPSSQVKSSQVKSSAVPVAGVPNGTTVAFGGQLCCFSAPPSDANATSSCPPARANHSEPLPEFLLFDIDADPAERQDLSQALPEVVQQLKGRLDAYNATNVPCCICTGSARTEEMDQPPEDGYWMSFRDQSDNPDPNCKLQNRPPPGGAQAEEESAGLG